MNKKLMTILALVLIAGVIAWLVSRDPGESKDPQADELTDRMTQDNESATNGDSHADVSRSSASTEVDEVQAGASISEVLEWQWSRGYYLDLLSLPEDYEGGIEVNHAYSSYDNATLSALAQDNDVVAATILADRIIGEGSDSGIEAHQVAAALGSTYSAIKVGSEYLSPHMSTNSEQRKANQITGLAWYQVAIGRGDPAGAAAFNLAVDGKNIDTETALAICQQAFEIRQRLEASRSDKQLPEFDDTPSPMTGEDLANEIFRPSLTCQ